LHLSYEFHAVNGLYVAPAVISYEYPVPKPTQVLTTSGSTTIWGNLIKVGGDHEPKALIRLRNEKLFSVKITREIINEIQEQKLIYKDLGFKGIATWRIENWAMESFKATGIVGYRPDTANLVDSFRELSEASRGRWETVDPVDYVKKLRSEEA
jgi:hypothetical protein